MARVLFAWELGGGLGHLAPIAGLGRRLAGRGHEVWLAVRDPVSAAAVMGEAPVHLVQAPAKSRFGREVIGPVTTFAQVLHNVGFGDAATLGALAGAWRELLGLIQPDVTVFDHSPTALLVSRGLAGAKKGHSLMPLS